MNLYKGRELDPIWSEFNQVIRVLIQENLRRLQYDIMIFLVSSSSSFFFFVYLFAVTGRRMFDS